MALANLDLPRDAAVVAVMRKSHVVPPRAETVLAAGDEILLLATKEMEDAVYQLLVGP
jgi:trk system potassium uptake protein TrkA